MRAPSANRDNCKQLNRCVVWVPTGGEGQKKYLKKSSLQSFQVLMKTINSEIQGAQQTPRLRKHEENHAKVHHRNKRKTYKAARGKGHAETAGSGGKQSGHKTWEQHLGFNTHWKSSQNKDHVNTLKTILYALNMWITSIKVISSTCMHSWNKKTFQTYKSLKGLIISRDTL